MKTNLLFGIRLLTGNSLVPKMQFDSDRSLRILAPAFRNSSSVKMHRWKEGGWKKAWTVIR